jgi:hypothetical protein
MIIPTGNEGKKAWQDIYENLEWAGSAKHDRCPGARVLKKYKEILKWLNGPIMDLGCGRGDTVRYMRSLNIKADGVDQVSIDEGMSVADITKPFDLSGYNSIVCFDVIEHIPEEQIEGLLENMSKVKRQAFTIHNGSSCMERKAWHGVKDKNLIGTELHVNRRPFKEWDKILSKWFSIKSCPKTKPNYRLYLTEAK